MGEPQNPHFYDFGAIGRVPEPQQPILFNFCDTRIRYTLSNSWNIFENIINNILKMSAIQNFEICGKDGRWKLPSIHLIKCRKSWIWDQYLSKNIDLTLWWYGSLKLWNFETKKLWNQETKNLRNQKNKKPGTPYPSTYQLPPLHPTTLVGTRANMGDTSGRL